MDLIVYLLLFFTASYMLVALFFFFGLSRLDNQPKTQQTPFISVVIAARNEEQYIGKCLESLQQQTYPTDLFEIIIVDDDSTDTTSQIIKSTHINNLTVLGVCDRFPEMAAKKRPMSVGIDKARGEWILTTDADCTVPPTWIASMASFMTPETGVVIGFSQLKTPQENLTLFERLQALDFLTLMSAAAGATGAGSPLAASGQNLAYRKTLFDQVGGFTKIAHRPSGDDVLLLQLLRKAWTGRIAFAQIPNAFATTWRPETPASFWQQRKRWASNAAYQLRLNPSFFAYITIVFLVNLFIPLGFLISFFQNSITLPLVCWALKISTDLLITGKGAYTFRRCDLLLMLPIWEVLQVPYTILIGLFGTLSGFTWKDRHHT